MDADSHQFYDSFAREVISKFQRIRALVAHNPANGDYHENVLRVVLRNFLSRRYSVKTGFVYKSETQVSNQIDIMVIDENFASAYIHQEGDFAIVRPNAVVAIIEVKSTLVSKEFDKSLANIASVKRLLENPNSIASIIFGYEGVTPSDKVFHNWMRRESALVLAQTPNLCPSAIMFFNHGMLMLRINNELRQLDIGNKYHYFRHISRLTQMQTEYSEGWQLRFVLALIYGACSKRELPGNDQANIAELVSELLTFSGAAPSVKAYEIGVGRYTY